MPVATDGTVLAGAGGSGMQEKGVGPLGQRWSLWPLIQPATDTGSGGTAITGGGGSASGAAAAGAPFGTDPSSAAAIGSSGGAVGAIELVDGAATAAAAGGRIKIGSISAMAA